MPLIAIYLIKLSVSLAVVFLFYQLILQKLTFYNWNRWYLMAYSALAFFIPLINISPVLKANEWNDNAVVKWLPVFDKNMPVKNAASTLHQYTAWDLCFFILLAGAILMSVRLILQWISFLRLKKNASLITVNNMSVYQVNKEIIPFSFGNSVFINSSLHHEQELQEIIRHEFVHVKQKHSLDIIWAEIICVLNWYNPFAWWLKKVIRQNLEFIADSRVLQEGIDKKDYQYLLLKVIGNHQFSIANQFNFSSLKKRIAMMNKIKTAKVHLVKFLFLLPLLSVSLLAFRSINTNSNLSNAIAKSSNGKNVVVAGLVFDAATLQPLAGVSIFCDRANETIVTDAHGYYKLYVPFGNEELKFSMSLSKEGYEGLKQNEHWGNFNYEGIYKAYGHTIELFALAKKGGEGYSAIAGNMPDESGLSY
ncbi:MAG: carboxypeptidase-like regulatory domain-containing protein, partial [Bacteroidetes bacterium]|nr:carboxypeptidase-like regulatory domain-containing protein [Bacteroidota bacterium]